MLKKLLSISALASLLVGGLSAAPANAVAATVDPANIVDGGVNVTLSVPSRTEVEIPEGLSRFTVSEEVTLTEAFLTARAGQVLSYDFSISEPNGTPIANGRQMYLPTVKTYSLDMNGYLYGPGPSSNVDYSTSTLAIPADPTDYQGYVRASVYVSAPTGQTLPAGTYSMTFALKTSSGETVASDAEGTTALGMNLTYLDKGLAFQTPASLKNATAQALLCVDVNKVAVGDVLDTTMVFDGTDVVGQDIYWRTKSEFKSNSDLGYRGFDGNDLSITVTEFDKLWGVTVSLNKALTGLVEGSTHDLAFRLFNQNGEDVSGSCAPAKPSAPTLSVATGSLVATGQFSSGSSAMMESECVVYDSAAPTVAVQTVNANTDWMNRSNYSCQFSSLTPGTTYLVKFRDAYRGIYSEYSDASQILVPAAGYTVTSSYAGVAEAKKIVNVSNNVLPVENYSQNTFTVPDGNGGFYMIGAKSGTCPPSCSTSEIRLRKGTATSMDSSFAGTGSVLLSGFTPTNAYFGGFGFYGAAKDKWAISMNGFLAGNPTGQSQIFFGSTTGSTVTSKLLSVSDVDALCGTASAGYVARPGSNIAASVVSAPTEKPLLQIFCYKAETIGGVNTYLGLPVLATIDTATGELTYKASLGTPAPDANNFSARISVNVDAASGEPMLTAFVTSSMVTQVNDFPTPNGGTITDHSVVRFDSNLNVLSTTPAAWGVSGGAISADPSLSVLTVNSGKIYAMTRLGSVNKVITFGATGAGVELAVDTSVSEIISPTVSLLSGQPTPANETVLPVSLSSSGKDAAGWIDLTTGVLTSGEVLTSTFSPGLGVTKFWLRGADKNSYFVYTDAASTANLKVLKWMDIRYVAPVGAIPAVTSKDVKYSKNTPTAGAKVTLTGTNLDEVISAKIGDNAATLGTKSATSLQLTIPTASAAGTVDITLTTAGGDTVVDTFTYVGLGIAQTVTVGALAASVTVGNADLTLSATVEFSPVDAGTAGAITWSSETPTVCSIVANKARLLTAGTCTVKATAAASGVLLAGSGTQSTAVSAAPAAAQTVTLTGPTKVVVDLDGFDVVSSASSRLAVKFTTSTPTICTVSSVGRVVAIAVGTCEITSTQAGNSSWLAASKTLTITVAKTPTTPLTEKGDIKKPLALSKTGTYLKNGDASLAWNRAKGTFAVKLSVVYVGPVKASISFKVGSKTYTCSAKFGILKKQSSSKLLTITSPNLCAAKTEKTQLAALKKITTSTVVTVTIVRDMYFPTTYKKIRTKTRVLYAKLG